MTTSGVFAFFFFLFSHHNLSDKSNDDPALAAGSRAASHRDSAELQKPSEEPRTERATRGAQRLLVELTGDVRELARVLRRSAVIVALFSQM